MHVVKWNEWINDSINCVQLILQSVSFALTIEMKWSRFIDKSLRNTDIADALIVEATKSNRYLIGW